MSANLDGVSARDKIRLLALTAGMEFYTIVAATVAIMTSNSVSFVTNLLIAVNGFIATGISLYTVRKMSSGKDGRYAYGFGKLETVSGLAVASTMIISILVIGYETVERLFHPVDVEGGTIGLIMTGISAVISTVLWVKNYRVSRQEPSPIFDSVWRLCRQGAIEDFLIIFAVGCGLVFRDSAWADYMDPLASMVLLYVLVMSVYAILSGSMDDLLDRSLGEYHQVLILRALAVHFDEYEQVHEIRTRRAGARMYVELFLEFAPERSMGEVYASIAKLKAELHEKMPNTEVLIVPTLLDTTHAHALAKPEPAVA